MMRSRMGLRSGELPIAPALHAPQRSYRPEPFPVKSTRRTLANLFPVIPAKAGIQ
jgi:hypothetical protein